MGKRSTRSRSESRPEWEQLEDWVRGHVQRLIQELLEEEVTEFLGRAKSALRSDSDNDTGYRNGYGRARRLTLSSGTIQLRRPRVHDTEEQFKSRLLPLFVNRTRKIAELIPELYLHGLSEGDFDLALRGLLGEDAPVSASTVARLKSKWNNELAQWRSRPLDDLEVVYMWVDGVYVKAGLEKEKVAVLVVMAALSDGSKVVVSTVPGYRESTESWSEVLREDMSRPAPNVANTAANGSSPQGAPNDTETNAPTMDTQSSDASKTHASVNADDPTPTSVPTPRISQLGQ